MREEMRMRRGHAHHHNRFPFAAEIDGVNDANEVLGVDGTCSFEVGLVAIVL